MKNLTIFLLLFPFILAAQEDQYHQSLRNQLQESFNISGGEWVLSDNESTTIDLGQVSSLTKTTLSWSGSEPFTKIVSYTNQVRRTYIWDSAVRFNTQTDIQKGDALLVVIWMRNVNAEVGSGYINHIFEKTTDPYTKSLNMSELTAKEWQQWLIPFEASMDHPAGSARYQINLGSMAQMLWVGGLAVINYGKSFSVDDLPSSDYHLSYEGRDENAAWRAGAEDRIEQYRKSNINIQVVDSDGNPIKDAEIKVKMLKHKFGFGSAVAVSRLINNGIDDINYRAKLADLTGDGRTFNVCVVENALKWPTWEDQNWPTDKLGTVMAVQGLRDMGLKVRGHNLVWPGWNYLPDDIVSNSSNSSYISQRIDDHIREIAGFEGLKGELYEWDVINEAVHNTDLASVFGGEEVYADWFNLAKQTDPDAELFLNEYSIINNAGMDFSSQGNFKNQIQFILDHGGPVEGIGIQCHMGYALTPIERIYEILNDYAQFGLDIAITEYDAVDVDPEVAADYMRDFLTVVFSHPQVSEFLMWGFCDKSHFASDAPIFDDDWSLKPSGEAFLDLVFNKWWTEESGTSNSEGSYSIRGFKGDYEISAVINGNIISDTLSLDENLYLTITPDEVITDNSDSRILPAEFAIEQNYPNPFNPSTSIRFSIPLKQYAELVVTDLLGREVEIIGSGIFNPGYHSIEFDGSDLASGIYFYSLKTDKGILTKKMLLLK